MTFAIGSRAGERRGSKPPGVFLYGIRLDGDDLRSDRLEVRKATLASILAKAAPPSGSRAYRRRRPNRLRPCLQDGAWRYRVEAKDSASRSGRSPDCLKMTNPACAAVTREAEEDRAR